MLISIDVKRMFNWCWESLQSQKYPLSPYYDIPSHQRNPLGSQTCQFVQVARLKTAKGPKVTPSILNLKISLLERNSPEGHSEF
ncbi:hypothetical protein EYC84_003580 [Monilinia fructicola]|uniref:Uncharacterized protein n=1 Tax=Monilinia fructicola TaxID=38448 RepID=A0A5M9JZA0_MONFR|nr:hypothetical protein EYC84_003580 [Monilinia fructicola]